MARLWKRVDGEPYMINPRLGVLALQALNPKGKRRRMAKYSSSRRHMAWVRSFRKKNYRARTSYRKSHRRKNPYPMAGMVSALGNPRRRKHNYHRRKRNPGAISRVTRGFFGLPPVMPVVYGAGGFIATAAIEGFIDTLVPATWKVNTDGSVNVIAKYLEIAAAIVAVTWAAKSFLGPGSAALAGIGGGVFLMTQLAHDFFPGVIPGMHAYTPLRAYSPVRRSGGMGGQVESAGGGFPQLATRASMPQLAARDIGAKKSAGFAADGGLNVVASRFRRFA